MSNVMRQRIPDRRSSMEKWTMSKCFGLYVRNAWSSWVRRGAELSWWRVDTEKFGQINTWKGHKDRNRHKNRIKRSRQEYVTAIDGEQMNSEDIYFLKKSLIGPLQTKKWVKLSEVAEAIRHLNRHKAIKCKRGNSNGSAKRAGGVLFLNQYFKTLPVSYTHLTLPTSDGV